MSFEGEGRSDRLASKDKESSFLKCYADGERVESNKGARTERIDKQNDDYEYGRSTVFE